MVLIECPECCAAVSDRAPVCPQCGYPLAEDWGEVEPAGEEIYYDGAPAMFRAHPFWFGFCLLLCPAGVGLIVFLIWWLRCVRVKLQVTNRRTILRVGLISKASREIRHCDAGDLYVRQGLMGRVFGVGLLELSLAGAEDEAIAVDGIRDPQGVADLIRQFQD